MKRILCYGDSNTWGYVSGTDHLRHDENERWTRLLGKLLGNDFEIIEEGLNSRTFVSVDTRPGREGREGTSWLRPCLDSQDKVDIVILMLGTNEFKSEYKKSGEEVAKMLSAAAEIILNYKSQIDKSTPRLIVSGTPSVNEDCKYCKEQEKFVGGTKKAEDYTLFAKRFCDEKGVTFIDNLDLPLGVDGIHITKEGHEILSKKLAKAVKGEN